jgi:soluble lytic murein transglycosylase
VKPGIGIALTCAWLAIAGPAAAPVWAHDTKPKATAKADPSVLSGRDKRIYKEAFRLAATKRFKRARAKAKAAENPLPAKILLWLELIEPGDGGNFRDAKAFFETNPDWPGQRALQGRVELSMPKDLPDETIQDWFEKRSSVTSEGAMLHAAALLRAGQRGRATTLLRRSWIERSFDKKSERAFRKRFAKMIRPEDNLARLERLLWAKQFRAARRQAARMGKSYPALAEARYQLSRRLPGVDWAIRQVSKHLRDDPGLIYERANWRKRKRRYEGVIELLDPPNPDAPRADIWWPLRHWAAREALRRGDTEVAYRIASAHGLDSGLGFAEGEWLAGWIALRFLDRRLTAYRHFARLNGGVVSPISLGRSGFWAGEAARAMDAHATDSWPHAEEAQWYQAALDWYDQAAEYKTTFYGQVARYRLGRAPIGDLPSSGKVSDEDRGAFDRLEIVRVVRLLGELEQDKLKKRFLLRLRATAKTAADYALVAELAHDEERPDISVRVAKSARRDGHLLPSQLYPSLTLPKGDKPEAALVLALIRQESAFYPEAVSRAGARGLMQLMPATAKRVARGLKIKYNREKLTQNPRFNLRLGRAYLADLTDRYDGSYILALAAYNAGPARADRWIRNFGDPRSGDVDSVDWIESIPLNETRNYVQRVLESLIVYRQHFDTGLPASESPDQPAHFTSFAIRGAKHDLSCCF